MAGKRRFSWGPPDETEAPTAPKQPLTEGKEVTFLKISELKEGNAIVDDTIKVRVTFAIPAFTSRSGVKVHNFNGIGSDMKEISFVSFSDMAQLVDQKIKEGNVYEITKFMVKTSNPNYIKCGNPLEILLKTSAEVEAKEDIDFPKIPFQFLRLDNVSSMTPGSVMDVLALVVDECDMQEVGPNAKKRVLFLSDQTKNIVPFILWNQKAETWSADEVCVVAIRNASVSVHDNKASLEYSTKAGTYIMVNPSTDDAKKMHEWFKVESTQ